MSIEEQVEAIQGRLPVVFPNQVYIRKDVEYVESYDPVLDIRITDTGIEIQGEPYLYAHSFDEFNRVYITRDEPVELAEEGEDDHSIPR